jgi:transposase
MQNKDMMYAVLICIASVMCVDRIGKSMAPTGYPKIATKRKEN